MGRNFEQRLQRLEGKVYWREYEQRQLAKKQLQYAHAKVQRVAQEVGMARIGVRKTEQVFLKMEEAEALHGPLNPNLPLRKYEDNMMYAMQLLISYFEDPRVRKAIVQELLSWVSELPVLEDVLYPFLDE